MAVELNVRGIATAELTIDTKHKATMVTRGTAVSTQTKTITPSDSQQIVEGDVGYLLSQVIVEPIPNTYGHISYNGSVLTVY